MAKEIVFHVDLKIFCCRLKGEGDNKTFCRLIQNRKISRLFELVGKIFQSS